MNCPVHDTRLYVVPHPKGTGQALCCPIVGCTYIKDAADNRAVSPKIPGLSSGRQSTILAMSEADVERQVDDGCNARRWQYLSTVHRYKRTEVTCEVCKSSFFVTPQGGYGATPGVPDRLLLPSWLPPYLAIMIELKGSKTAFTKSTESDAQRRLSESRRTVVARSFEDVENVLAYVAQMLSPIRGT